VRRFILLFLLVPACALAQSGVWGLRGITKRFVVHGNVVYAVDGRGVTAYDATTLKRLQTIETESESLDAAFTGNTLVVLTRGGLERFPPESVVPIARQEIPPSTRIASNGQRIAVAGADGVAARAHRIESGRGGHLADHPWHPKQADLSGRIRRVRDRFGHPGAADHQLALGGCLPVQCLLERISGLIEARLRDQLLIEKLLRAHRIPLCKRNVW
jgi:hypothetical protein